MRGRGRGITERLARACAAHPWRTVAAWGVAVVVSVALLATVLHGLTSDANVVGKPDSTKAADLLAKAFPPTRAELKHQVSDVVVVRSERYAVDAPAFRSFVAAFVHRARATGEVLAVQSYL